MAPAAPLLPARWCPKTRPASTGRGAKSAAPGAGLPGPVWRPAPQLDLTESSCGDPCACAKAKATDHTVHPTSPTSASAALPAGVGTGTDRPDGRYRSAPVTTMIGPRKGVRSTLTPLLERMTSDGRQLKPVDHIDCQRSEATSVGIVMTL